MRHTDDPNSSVLLWEKLNSEIVEILHLSRLGIYIEIFSYSVLPVCSCKGMELEVDRIGTECQQPGKGADLEPLQGPPDVRKPRAHDGN